MNKEYYILEGDDKQGPFTFNELIRMDIDIHTEILVGTAEDPVYASELPELNEYFEAQEIYFPTEDNLATFGKRTAAFLTDYIAVYIIVEMIETRMGWVVLPTKFSIGAEIPPSMLTLYFSFFAIFLVYNTIFEATKLKGSLGKKIFKLSVVDIDGKGLSIPRAFARNLGVLLSVTIWLPFLSVLFSEHRQAWYDSLAKTYIISTK